MDTPAPPVTRRKPSLMLDPRQRRYPMTSCPTGWYALLRSEELDRGDVKTLQCFSQDVVLFRDEHGTAHVLDPFCPHLGAHLGHGGRVSGTAIVCPYHHWEFGGDGRCVRAASDGRPPNAGVYSWPVDEVNGLIFAWYDPERALPSYRIPRIPEWAAPQWSRYEQIVLEAQGHVIELQENLLDETHFVTIHRRQEPLMWNFEPRGPFATARARMRVGPRQLPFFYEVTAEFFGPGMIALRTRGLTNHTVLSLGTPIDEHRSLYRLLFLTKKPRHAPLLAGLMNRLLRIYARGDLRKEARIWERRIYPSRPVYSATDRSIPKFRAWYRQFHQPEVPPTSIGSDEGREEIDDATTSR